MKTLLVGSTISILVLGAIASSIFGVMYLHDVQVVSQSYTCYSYIDGHLGPTSQYPNVSEETRTLIINKQCGINEEGMIEGWLGWYVFDQFDRKDQ